MDRFVHADGSAVAGDQAMPVTLYDGGIPVEQDPSNVGHNAFPSRSIPDRP
jgi:hypothetical protein